MAMSSENKLYAAIGVLVVLGGAYYLTSKEKAEDIASHSYGELTKDLPPITVSDDDIKKIDKIVLTKPKKEDGDTDDALEHILVKKGEEWRVDKPVDALANQSNVESLLKNLKTLQVKELISKSKEDFAQYDVTDDKALHAVFYKGKDAAYEFWFGKKGGIGQVTRIKGHDGAYAVDGYSPYLYGRDTKGWRDLKIFEFDEKKAKAIDLQNENGFYAFEKGAEGWTVKYKKTKLHPAGKIEDFESSKVDDMLRAFKTLNANAFGDGKKPEEVGLAEPIASLVITLEDGGKRDLFVGSNAEGSSRWVKSSGEQIYSISSWAGDWTTAAPEKFQKKKEEAEAKEGDDLGEDDGADPHGGH